MIIPARSAASHDPELEAVREMTAAMLAAAENERWTEVQRIDEARAKLLHGLPAELFRSADDNVRSLLGAALAATLTVERRITDARGKLGRELKQRNQRYQAAQAYQSAR